MSTHYTLDPEDWISQAEAARLRHTTRQAIARLIARGRLRTLVVADRTLVHRADVLNFSKRPAGRPNNAPKDV